VRPARFLADLLPVSHGVVLTLPLTEQTRGMIDAAAIERMHSDPVLVNIGRGGVIDEPALIQALEQGRLSGAALDVFATEPPPPDNELWSLPNVLPAHTPPACRCTKTSASSSYSAKTCDATWPAGTCSAASRRRRCRDQTSETVGIRKPVGLASDWCRASAGRESSRSGCAIQRKETDMTERHTVKVGRVYDPPTRDDGARVLVDRIWPRGLSKDKAHLDEWCKSVAPSTTLRKWYQHDPERFEEFARRYRAELDEPEHAEALQHLRQLARHRPLTLLTATKHAEISEAVVLADLLRK
jgi:uncharacterized protein YeaO (DUF488 family)